MSRPRVALVLLALGAGCDGSELPTVDADTVLELRAECPEGSVCERVADGRSRVTVRACIPDTVAAPRVDARLSLTLSSGRWEGQDAATRTVSASIQNERCFNPTFITGTELARVRVDAEVQGFRKFIELPLRPAPLTDIELLPAPLNPRAGQESQLQVQVRAANGGTPTQGTRLAFSVEDVEPSGAQAVIWPGATLLDASGGALGRLLLSPDVQRLTVRLKATSPEADADTRTVERTFSLTATP